MPAHDKRVVIQALRPDGSYKIIDDADYDERAHALTRPPTLRTPPPLSRTLKRRLRLIRTFGLRRLGALPTPIPV